MSNQVFYNFHIDFTIFTSIQIYLEKMVLTKQTDVLLSGRACVETTAVARFFTTEYEISGRVVTVCSIVS